MLPSGVPYRIDIDDAPDDALESLIDLGALDVEVIGEGLAALLPDDVSVGRVSETLGRDDIRVTQAEGRLETRRWSFRWHGFVRDGSGQADPPCTPTLP